MKHVDPKLSEAFRELAKYRKHFRSPFVDDPEFASEMGKKGQAKRWKGHVSKTGKKADAVTGVENDDAGDASSSEEAA